MRGTQARKAVHDAADDALLKVGRLILERAINKLPVGDPALDPDPGVSLRGLGSVTKVQDDVIMVKFDGPYAAYHHENRGLAHPRGGQAQFLGDALKETIPQIAGVAAGEVRAQVMRKH